MPQLFFHVKDGGHFTDTRGTELRDLAAVGEEPLVLCECRLQDQQERFSDGVDWHIRVADDTELPSLSLTFSASNSAAISGEES